MHPEASGEKSGRKFGTEEHKVEQQSQGVQVTQLQEESARKDAAASQKSVDIA